MGGPGTQVMADFLLCAGLGRQAGRWPYRAHTRENVPRDRSRRRRACFFSFHPSEKQAEFAGGYVIQQGPKYAFALAPHVGGFSLPRRPSWLSNLNCGWWLSCLVRRRR